MPGVVPQVPSIYLELPGFTARRCHPFRGCRPPMEWQHSHGYGPKTIYATRLLPVLLVLFCLSITLSFVSSPLRAPYKPRILLSSNLTRERVFRRQNVFQNDQFGIFWGYFSHCRTEDYIFAIASFRSSEIENCSRKVDTQSIAAGN